MKTKAMARMLLVWLIAAVAGRAYGIKQPTGNGHSGRQTSDKLSGHHHRVRSHPHQSSHQHHVAGGAHGIKQTTVLDYSGPLTSDKHRGHRSRHSQKEKDATPETEENSVSSSDTSPKEPEEILRKNDVNREAEDNSGSSSDTSAAPIKSEVTLLTFLIHNGQTTTNAPEKSSIGATIKQATHFIGSQFASIGVGKKAAYYDAPLSKRGYEDALNLYIELQKSLAVSKDDDAGVGTCVSKWDDRKIYREDCCAALLSTDEKGKCYFSGYAELMMRKLGSHTQDHDRKYFNLLGETLKFGDTTMTYAQWMSSSRSLDATSNLRRTIDTYAIGIGLAGGKSDKAKAAMIPGVMIDSELQELGNTDDDVSKITTQGEAPKRVEGGKRQAVAMGEMCKAWQAKPPKKIGDKLIAQQRFDDKFVAECTKGMIGYINGFYKKAIMGYNEGHYVDDSQRRRIKKKWPEIAKLSMIRTLSYMHKQYTKSQQLNPVAVLSGHSNFWREAIAAFMREVSAAVELSACKPLYETGAKSGGVLAVVWTKTQGRFGLEWEITSCKLVLGRWQD